MEWSGIFQGGSIDVSALKIQDRPDSPSQCAERAGDLFNPGNSLKIRVMCLSAGRTYHLGSSREEIWIINGFVLGRNRLLLVQP